MTRLGYNQRKAVLLQAVQSLGPAYVTAREILETLIRTGEIAAPPDYHRELRVISQRLLVLSRSRQEGETYGYSRPYLTTRMTIDDDTGRPARAYRISAKGESVLAKMRDGRLRGIVAYEPPKPGTRAARHRGTTALQMRNSAGELLWDCGNRECARCGEALASRTHDGTRERGLFADDGEPCWDCGRKQCTVCELVYSQRQLPAGRRDGGEHVNV